MQQVLHDLPLTLAYIGSDLVAITLLVGALYIPRHGRRDLVAAYIGVNVGVLAVTLLLSTASVAAGLGLGLFGVLSIIRLRSTELAQHEVAYFFAALALGLLGGIQTAPIGMVAALMGTVVAALWIGDHPALMRRNRHQVIVLDHAITNETALIAHLEHTLGGQVRSVEVQRLDLVNDTTIVDVRFRAPRQTPAELEPETSDLSRLSNDDVPASKLATEPVAGAPAAQPKDTGTQQVRQVPQESAPQAPHLIEEVPLQTPTPIQPVQTPTPIQPVGQQAWPGALSHDSAASAATAPPRHDWITGNRQQHTPQRHSQPSAPPPPVANPRYN